MPELPEVETIKKDLKKVLPGLKILELDFDEAKLLKPSVSAFKKRVLNQEITQVNRRAKVVEIQLKNTVSILVHLKLTGRLLFRDKADPVDEWQHVILELSKSKQLRFCDLRKFGWLKALTPEEVAEELANYGPEPAKNLTRDYFQKVMGSTRRAVKIVLMDQKLIAGIGNIYANDALLLAKIDPRRSANSLSVGEIKRLYEMVEKVIADGLRYRGASDNHFLDAFGRKGHYQDHFVAYGKTGRPCPVCGTKIERIVVGGRGTFICSNCQK